MLIIFPFTQDYPVHAQLAKGFREGLCRPGQTVRISYEYLDLARFTDEAGYLAEVARFFQEKYSRLKPDVVVSGGPLREFLSRYAEMMFPGVPVVFPREENAALEALPDSEFVTSRNSEYMKSVDIIFRTRPDTKKVYVILGDSDEERDIQRNMARVANAYRDRAAFVFTNGLPYAKMLDLLRGAGKDEAVLFMRWLRDSEGKSFIPEDVLRNVSGVSKAPVYTVVAPSLEGGVVGGYLFSFELFGRRLAEETLAILEGNASPGQASPVSANEYLFDWRELKRWNISEKLLPEGSRVEFREQSVWDLYKGYVVAALAFMLLEASLIGGFLVSQARRKKVERELVQLNASLERRVEERTRELREANEELNRAKLQLEEMNRRLDLSSRTDTLTGLYNRRHAEEAFDQEMAKHSRTGERFSVVVCDLDFFKEVNDRHGHDAGDALLRMVADDLARSVRPYDTLSRWGGEEFLLLLPGTRRDEALALAERIRKSVQDRVYDHGELHLRLTVTLGVSSVEKGDSVSEVIKRADEALYQGKRSGRNRVVAG